MAAGVGGALVSAVTMGPEALTVVAMAKATETPAVCRRRPAGAETLDTAETLVTLTALGVTPVAVATADANWVACCVPKEATV